VTLLDSSTNIARNISNALAIELSVRRSELYDYSRDDATDNDRGGLSHLAYFLILLHNPLDAGLGVWIIGRVLRGGVEVDIPLETLFACSCSS
jgi:hypothetical protein